MSLVNPERAAAMMSKEQVIARVRELLGDTVEVSFKPSPHEGDPEIVRFDSKMWGELSGYREGRRPGEFEQELDAMCWVFVDSMLRTGAGKKMLKEMGIE